MASIDSYLASQSIQAINSAGGPPPTTDSTGPTDPGTGVEPAWPGRSTRSTAKPISMQSGIPGTTSPMGLVPSRCGLSSSRKVPTGGSRRNPPPVPGPINTRTLRTIYGANGYVTGTNPSVFSPGMAPIAVDAYFSIPQDHLFIPEGNLCLGYPSGWRTDWTHRSRNRGWSRHGLEGLPGQQPSRSRCNPGSRAQRAQLVWYLAR